MTKCCAVCNKKWGSDPSPFYFTLKGLSEGTQEELFICEDCKLKFSMEKSPFTRVYPPTHMREQQPFFWYNEKPLRPDQALDPLRISLSYYPLIEDFEVMVLCWIEPNRSDKEACHASARFVSSSRGYLTYALDVDLRLPDFVLPQGDFERPYHFDVGLDMLCTSIAEYEDFVYIVTDNKKSTLIHERKNDLYSTWFKVDKNRYYSQWKQAIYVARSLFAEQ